MIVAEAMHSGVRWVSPDASLREVARIMRDEDIGAVPVGKDDRLVGMVTDRDIAIRACTSDLTTSTLTAGDVMSSPIVCCRANQSIEEAARYMQSRRIRRLPVIDANKRMVGMLSLGDLSHCGHQGVAAEAMVATNAHHPDQLIAI